MYAEQPDNNRSSGRCNLRKYPRVEEWGPCALLVGLTRLGEFNFAAQLVSTVTFRARLDELRPYSFQDDLIA